MNENNPLRRFVSSNHEEVKFTSLKRTVNIWLPLNRDDKTPSMALHFRIHKVSIAGAEQ
jgi:hypothetical protein